MRSNPPIGRRDFLAFSLPFLLGMPSFPSWCKSVRMGEEYLGLDWRLPRDTTIEIWPTEMGLDLSKAISAICDWSIPSTSRVVIRLSDGEHALSSPVIPQSLSGERLAIVGNRSNPERCRIIWERPEDTFYLASGYCLGLVDGVIVEHLRATSRGSGSAFLADAGGMIRCGPNLRVRGFYYGFQARHGGSILCNQTHSANSGDANYFAFSGGHIQAEGAVAEFADDPEKRLGGGFVAEYGGTINARGSVARHNALAGYVALSNGVIRAYDSVAEFNGKAGYFINTGGVIVAHRGVARHNCGVAVKSEKYIDSGFEGDQFREAENYFDSSFCKN